MEGVEAELRKVLRKAEKEHLSRDDVNRLLGLKRHSKSKPGLVYLILQVNIPIKFNNKARPLYFSIRCRTFDIEQQYEIFLYR